MCARCAKSCSGAVMRPGIAQLAFSIQFATGRPCGGPWNANSGSTTSFGGSALCVAVSISASACAMFSSMIVHAPSRWGALTASLLTVWMQVARHGSMVISGASMVNRQVGHAAPIARGRYASPASRPKRPSTGVVLIRDATRKHGRPHFGIPDRHVDDFGSHGTPVSISKALSHSVHRIERFGLRKRPIDVEIPNMRKDRLNEAPPREFLRLQRHVEAARNPVQRFAPIDAGRPAVLEDDLAIDHDRIDVGIAGSVDDGVNRRNGGI